MSGEYDFEAEVQLIGRAESAARDGTRFEHALGAGLRVPGVHLLPTAPNGQPDNTTATSSTLARVRLEEAGRYPRSLRIGQDIQLFQAGAVRGHARVRSIARTLLDIDSQDSPPRRDVAAAVCALVPTLGSRSSPSQAVGDEPGAANEASEPLAPGSSAPHTAAVRHRIEQLRLVDAIAGLRTSELYEQLAAHPDWADEWYAWAESHKLRAGPFLFRYQHGGWTGFYECSGVAMESMRFEDPLRACAEFIALELEESGLLDRHAAV